MQSKILKCTERGLIQPHHSALLKSEDMAERCAVVSCHEKKEESHKDKKKNPLYHSTYIDLGYR